MPWKKIVASVCSFIAVSTQEIYQFSQQFREEEVRKEEQQVAFAEREKDWFHIEKRVDKELKSFDIAKSINIIVKTTQIKIKTPRKTIITRR